MYLFLTKSILHHCIIIHAENRHTTTAVDDARYNNSSRSTNQTKKAQQSRQGKKTGYGVNARNVQRCLRSRNLQAMSKHSAGPLVKDLICQKMKVTFYLSLSTLIPFNCQSSLRSKDLCCNTLIIRATSSRYMLTHYLLQPVLWQLIFNTTLVHFI